MHKEEPSTRFRSTFRRLPKITFEEDQGFVLSYAPIHLSMLIVYLESEFEQIEVSKWRRRFDIYASRDPEKAAVGGHRKSYTIVTRSSDDTLGKTLVARLYYSQLGLAADVQRVISSKHRTLYIGPIPG